MTDICARLFSMQDEKYRDFNAKLIPDIERERVIGVRTPLLRAFAKELRGTPAAAEFLAELPHTYFEENSLHAFLLEFVTDREQLLAEIRRFLPFVDNWATCDSFSPKLFKKHPPQIAHIDAWLQSGQTYTVRYGMGCLMRYYLDERFAVEYAARVAAVQSEEYYIRMMQSWYFATALAKQWEAVLPFLTEGCLDVWVHKKTIQKAVESYRISAEQKAYLRALKRA